MTSQHRSELLACRRWTGTQNGRRQPCELFRLHRHEKVVWLPSAAGFSWQAANRNHEFNCCHNRESDGPTRQMVKWSNGPRQHAWRDMEGMDHPMGMRFSQGRVETTGQLSTSSMQTATSGHHGSCCARPHATRHCFCIPSPLAAPRQACSLPSVCHCKLLRQPETNTTPYPPSHVTSQHTHDSIEPHALSKGFITAHRVGVTSKHRCCQALGSKQRRFP